MKLATGIRIVTHPHNLRGYTLIEILIVMVIISIITTVATLAIHHNENKQIEHLAHKITRLLNLATEEALLRSATLSVGFSNTQLQFYSAIEKNQKIQWQPISQTSLAPMHYSSNILIVIKINGEIIPLDGKPSIIISPSGDLPEFIILLGKKNSTPLYQVSSTAEGLTISGYLHEE